MTAKKSYQVFISRKSTDNKWGKELYDFFTRHGISVFESDVSLQEIGQTNYNATINEILEEVEHLIVMASKKDHLTSSWVQAEWETFENECRSGRKNGNLLVIIKVGIKISDLPLALRQKQVFYYKPSEFDKILPYVGHVSQPKEIEISELWRNKFKVYIWSILIVFLLSAGAYSWIYRITNDQFKKSNEKLIINTDSLFNITKQQFLEEGLSKEIALENFKDLVEHDPQYIDQAVEVFEEKANRVPFLANKYYVLSEELLNHLDSIRNGN